MVRWQPGTADRLRRSAVRLFTERGFAATTAADIARDAGVTERTFFRHFADKEEVLFDDDARLEAIIVTAARQHLADDRSTDSRPIDRATERGRAFGAASAGMRALAADFDGDRDAHRRRASILAQMPGLQGRQLLKQERWVNSVRATLEADGVDAADAAAAVELAAAAMRLAYAAWLHGSAGPGLVARLADTEQRLIGVAVAGGTPESGN
jgi:AcrR family transcriptional regulator